MTATLCFHRLLRRAAPLCGLLLAMVCVSSDAEAGCGDYVHIRGWSYQTEISGAGIRGSFETRILHGLNSARTHFPANEPVPCTGPMCRQRSSEPVVPPATPGSTATYETSIAILAAGLESTGAPVRFLSAMTSPGIAVQRQSSVWKPPRRGRRIDGAAWHGAVMDGAERHSPAMDSPDASVG
jgi:hypothetical protein